MLENNLHRNMVISVKNFTSTITAPAIVDKDSQLTITCVAEGYRAPHYIALEKDDVTEKNWDRDTDCTSLLFYKFQCEYIVASSGKLRLLNCPMTELYLSITFLMICGAVHSF